MACLHKSSVGVLAAFAVCLTLLAAGCGPSCAELAQRYAASLRPPRPGPGQGWHLALALPWELVNQRLRGHLPRDLPLALPLAGGLGSAPPLRLRLEGLTLQPAAQDQLEVQAELAVLAGSERAFHLALSAALAPTLQQEQGAVELGLEPAALREARLQLAPGAAAALADAIYRQLPAGAKRFVSPQLARLMARGLVEQLSSRLTGLLLEHYGEKLASLARLRLRLPQVPLQRLGLRSYPGQGGGLVVLAQLKVASSGITDPTLLLSPQELADAGGRGSLLLALRPQAAADLLNQARAAGRLPARYNYAGQADPTGELEVAFGWRPGSHPLKITIWRLGGERCAAVTFGLKPQVISHQGQLVLQLNDRRLEQTQGRSLALAALWWQSLGQQASERQQRLARGLTLHLGPAEQHLRPVKATIASERLLLELHPSSATAVQPTLATPPPGR